MPPPPRVRVAAPWLERVALALVLVVFATLGAAHAAATPPWNNPDEPAHFNYVAQVAHSGTLPVLQEGDWDWALLEWMKATRFANWEAVPTVRYEGWQPPLYYLLASRVLLLAPSDHPVTQVHMVRLFGVALGCVTLLVAFGVARRLLASEPRPLALLVPLGMAGVPMFAAISGSVSNDPLANLMATTLTLLLLRLPARPSARQVAALGLALGLALLTKLTLLVFVPLALGVALARGWGDRRPWLAPLLVGLVALLVLSPWLARQGLVYGWDDILATRRHDAVVVGQERFPGLSVEYARFWLTTLFHSFWAQFGWMGVPVSDSLYAAWGLLAALALLGVGRRAWTDLRRRQVDPAHVIAVLIPLAVLALVVAYNATYIQAQGRYLFPSLAALMGLTVLGWASLLPRAGRVAGAATLAALLVPLSWTALLDFVVPSFRG